MIMKKAIPFPNHPMKKPKNPVNQIGQWFELTANIPGHKIGERLMCSGIKDDESEVAAYFENSFMKDGHTWIPWSGLKKVILTDESLNPDDEMKIYIKEVVDQRGIEEEDYDWPNILKEETKNKHFPKK